MKFYWVFPYFRENVQMVVGKSTKYVYAKGLPPINYTIYNSIIERYVKAVSEKCIKSHKVKNC
ncbi:hypothetical protein DWX43_26465 [Clostridium sp. AF19-22AC]|nr:hypothetical protein DWX43_26465 [Clostridium sp. AF19-22AC]